MASEKSRVLSTRVRRVGGGAVLAGLAATLAGCLGYDGVINRGAVIEERKVAQVKVGMPAPQVLALLGTPSTTSTVGGDAWYYVSQRLERQLAFMPQEVADQHILAVYFDKSKNVQRTADYGLQDGKVVDFLTRTTPSASADFQLLRSMFAKIASMSF
ncbi:MULTISPECIES: outer membrane protein assembly factor BamE [Methylosinus]|uniref:Outer membrane protein assembly factor BamE n=1 Tax=Methylosinus trichosporium (strain ATCC 35070 / NCIMB 11131 / UNIQEM 75 / OB3b) TaxID=595536 RepID=A0A2D2CWN6_METT3|nr:MULTISPECIES: outer membrane protein assembly factor BamE [Methylosinus]ATQ67094.1 outer membrane protein assembly factor BamE [Methylosinus trichosporium OB3b]OBS52749.1 cell envelope protein SmpA [Methylosinus sp. 3S-1]